MRSLRTASCAAATRRRAAHRDRRNHAREQHGVPHRDDDHRVLGHRPVRRRAAARRRRLRARGALVFGQCLLRSAGVHAPSFLRNVSVSTPSASSFCYQLERHIGVGERQRDAPLEAPVGNLDAVDVRARARGRETPAAPTPSTPPGSTISVMESGGTPGSATCTRRSLAGLHDVDRGSQARGRRASGRKELAMQAFGAAPPATAPRSTSSSKNLAISRAVRWRRGWRESSPLQELRPVQPLTTRRGCKTKPGLAELFAALRAQRLACTANLRCGLHDRRALVLVAVS